MLSDTMENNTKKEPTKELSFVRASKKNCPTRFLFVSRADLADPNVTSDMIETFSAFGDLDTAMGPICIHINQKRHASYVCFQDKEGCQRAYLAAETGAGISLKDGAERLICRYTDMEKSLIAPPEAECISITRGIEVPGLSVTEDFVSEEEEEYLLDFCDTRNAEKFFSKGNE